MFWAYVQFLNNAKTTEKRGVVRLKTAGGRPASTKRDVPSARNPGHPFLERSPKAWLRCRTQAYALIPRRMISKQT